MGVISVAWGGRGSGTVGAERAAAPLFPPRQAEGVGYFRRPRTRLGAAPSGNQRRAQSRVAWSRWARLALRRPLGPEGPDTRCPRLARSAPRPPSLSSALGRREWRAAAWYLGRHSDRHTRDEKDDTHADFPDLKHE